MSGYRYAIRFSEDWDKLASPRFTTIRSYRLDKAAYYRGIIGETFDVVRDHNFNTPQFFEVVLGHAILRSMEVVVPAQLPRTVLEEDVRIRGWPSNRWLRKLLAMPKGLLLTFEYILSESAPLQSNPDPAASTSRQDPDARGPPPEVAKVVARPGPGGKAGGADHL